MYTISKRRQCVLFNANKKQSGIGFIVDALFGNFTYLHNLYTVVKLNKFWKSAEMGMKVLAIIGQ